MNAGSRLLLASSVTDVGGGLACAACLAVALSERARQSRSDDPMAATVLFDGSSDVRRRPTLLASEPARRLEEALVAVEGVRAVARGALCWAAPEEAISPTDSLREVISLDQPLEVVAYLPASDWRVAFDDPVLRPDGVLIRADRARHANVCALLARELREKRVAHSIQTTAPGLVASRRAIAGIAPGGEAEARARRLAWRLCGKPSRPGASAADVTTRLLAETGQALPLMLGAAFVVLTLALVAVAIGSAGTAAGRVQRAADLAAVSAARSMRDERQRLFEPSRLPDGRPNPQALSLERFEGDARATAVHIAATAGIPAQRLRVSFPDAGGGAPTRVTVEVGVALRGAGIAGRASHSRPIDVEAKATAEAVVDSGQAPAGQPASASGDYSGPLSYRQGKPMRPDVALAFDRMAAAASNAGVALTINSAYRSDAEQAALFAAHPDPQWVAPPGVSLHRCATELDLGPSTAYGWLAANAGRFGFVQRYSWEAWHYGYTRGPAPCSEEANQVGRGRSKAEDADGGSAATALPSFVPARYRLPISRAATRWNVSAGLLAAQLMAESGFDPNAGSPAGAQGIAQFIPSTAAAYGLDDPFDPLASIEAQAHLMSDNLKRFGTVELALAAYNAGPAPVLACHCVPPYPETQAYVTRILDLMGGAGEVLPPALEVRLVA